MGTGGFGIPQKCAAAINDFYTDALNPYLNFHGPRPPGRPCYFAAEEIDAKGKIRKTYPHNQIMTPWERLQTVPTYENYLKPSITIESLEPDANALRWHGHLPPYGEGELGVISGLSRTERH